MLQLQSKVDSPCMYISSQPIDVFNSISIGVIGRNVSTEKANGSKRYLLGFWLRYLMSSCDIHWWWGTRCEASLLEKMVNRVSMR